MLLLLLFFQGESRFGDFGSSPEFCFSSRWLAHVPCPTRFLVNFATSLPLATSAVSKADTQCPAYAAWLNCTCMQTGIVAPRQAACLSWRAVRCLPYACTSVGRFSAVSGSRTGCRVLPVLELIAPHPAVCTRSRQHGFTAAQVAGPHAVGRGRPALALTSPIGDRWRFLRGQPTALSRMCRGDT